MINNDTIRAKRRKRSVNTIDLNDPVAMRLRIIRLEEEAARLLKLESERINTPNSFVGDLILTIYEMGERDAKEI